MTTQALSPLRLFDPPARQKLTVLRPTATAALAAAFVVSLAASVTVSVTQVQAQSEHTRVVSDLEATVGGLTSAVKTAESSVASKKTELAEYRSLLLEQDAAFANTDGFLQ